MYQLIITVMSIALTAAMATISINYINPGLPIERQAQNRIVTGFSSLDAAWQQYREEHQTFDWTCDSHTTQVSVYEVCDRVVATPGYLAVSGWSDTLVPEYLFLPQPPMGMTWSYGTNPSGWYFCAEGAASKHQLRGFDRAQRNFMVGQLVVGNACGAESGLPLESLNKENMKITYWLKRN